ncbi:MAG: pilus assembly protein CpaB [Nocardioidaceae bacterium]|nr:pilus assembly protein CpaB [Nocardioidaceae bacterium]
MTRAPAVLRRLRRTVLAHRRGLAAVCVGLAVAAGLQSQAAPAARTVSVLVAAHDLGGGVVVRPRDLAVVPFEPESVPSGAVGSTTEALGRTTVGAVRAGEPLTDVRLLGAGLLGQQPGSVAAPVRIGDADALDLLRVGDRIDILAADPRRRSDAVVVAEDVPVLAVPSGGRTDQGLLSGGLLVVAVPEATALGLAGLGVSSFLSFVLVG